MSGTIHPSAARPGRARVVGPPPRRGPSLRVRQPAEVRIPREQARITRRLYYSPAAVVFLPGHDQKFRTFVVLNLARMLTPG